MLQVVAYRAAKSSGNIWRVKLVRDSSFASRNKACLADVQVHELKFDDSAIETNADLTIHAANFFREFNCVVQVWSVHHGKDSGVVDREVTE